MTNDGNNTLVYDAENRVLSATNGGTSGAYTYDGNSLRVQKVSGGTTTIYIFSGTKVIAEYSGTSAPYPLAREYIYSGGTLLAKIESGATKYYHPDHLSNRVVSDSSGNSIAQLGHYSFGESWYNTTNDKLLFTSYERDAESGNDYAMMRSSVNRLARFSSPNPLHASIVNPQSLNRFAYVLNDPANFVDPLGLDETVPCTFDGKPALCSTYPVGKGGDGGGGGGNDGVYDGFGGLFGGAIDEPPPPLIYVGGRKGSGGLLNKLKAAYCSALPSGRSTSVSVATGGVGSVSGSLDTVVNYNSGQTSLFATGGGGLGWNGGGSLTATTGLVYGLDGTNNRFSGVFKGGNLYVPTPVPGVSAGGSITHGGGVTVVSAGASGALAGKYGFGGSWTNTTQPLNVGNFTGYSSIDYIGYLLRRPCN